MAAIVGSGVENNQYSFRSLTQSYSRANRAYVLRFRQQPKHSRMCGFGEKVDRRPIDPPPIIQLNMQDLSTNEDNSIYLYTTNHFMYASLIAPDSEEELHLLRDGKTRTTTGSIVSSLFRLKDTDGKDSAFFVFPDLSIRIEGSYRLKFSLFEIINTEIHYCDSIYSEVFNVYPAKTFPGMKESTFLSRSFAEQGLKIKIRKELRLRKGKRNLSERGDIPMPKKKRGKKSVPDNSDGGDSESDDECNNRSRLETNSLKTESSQQQSLGPTKHDIKQNPTSGRALYYQPQYTADMNAVSNPTNYAMGYYEQPTIYGQFIQQPINMTSNRQPRYANYSSDTSNNGTGVGGLAMAGIVQKPLFDGRTGNFTTVSSNNNTYGIANKSGPYNYIATSNDRCHNRLQALSYSQPQNGPSVVGIPMHGPPMYGVSPVPNSVMNNQLPSPTSAQSPFLGQSLPKYGNGASTYNTYKLDHQRYHSLPLPPGGPAPLFSNSTTNLSGVTSVGSSLNSLPNNGIENRTSTCVLSMPYVFSSSAQQYLPRSFVNLNPLSIDSHRTVLSPPPTATNNRSIAAYEIQAPANKTGKLFSPNPMSLRYE